MNIASIRVAMHTIQINDNLTFGRKDSKRIPNPNADIRLGAILLARTIATTAPAQTPPKMVVDRSEWPRYPKQRKAG